MLSRNNFHAMTGVNMQTMQEAMYICAKDVWFLPSTFVILFSIGSRQVFLNSMTDAIAETLALF